MPGDPEPRPPSKPRPPGLPELAALVFWEARLLELAAGRPWVLSRCTSILNSFGGESLLVTGLPDPGE